MKTSTPMTPELFMQWKKKKIAERDAGLASQMAERAKNDRMRCFPSLYQIPLFTLKKKKLDKNENEYNCQLCLFKREETLFCYGKLLNCYIFTPLQRS